MPSVCPYLLHPFNNALIRICKRWPTPGVVSWGHSGPVVSLYVWSSTPTSPPLSLHLRSSHAPLWASLNCTLFSFHFYYSEDNQLQFSCVQSFLKTLASCLEVHLPPPLTPERTTQTLWNKDCSCFLWPFHVVLVSTCSQLVPAFLPHSPQHTNTLTLFYFICTFICTKLSCHESLPQGTHRISCHWSPPRLVTTCLSSFCLPFFLFYAATFNATVGL